MKFIVRITKFGSMEDKFRDADSEYHEFMALAELLHFLITMNFSTWDKISISEMIEEEIIDIKLQ